MPELPEVETIKRGLSEHIVGQEISGVKRLWAKTLQAKPADIKSKIVGSKIKCLRRRGKVLIIDLDNGYSLLFHLKMTGQIIADMADDGRFSGGHPTKSMESKLPDRSTRIIFELCKNTAPSHLDVSQGVGEDRTERYKGVPRGRTGAKNEAIRQNGRSVSSSARQQADRLRECSKLYFNDQRKFGWIKLVPTVEVDKDKLLARLGPEPLEAAFDVDEFITTVKRRKAPIKAVLLDQNTVAGVGNIYADEALHMAKIHPAKRASNVSKAKLKDLHRAVIDVMEASLKYGGTTFTNYVNHLGKKGDYLRHARVFNRAGEPCPARLPDGQVCATPIEKIRVAGRGTHICPKCQKK